MKNGILKKLLAGTLIASMTLSSVAFAADTGVKSLNVTYGGMGMTLNNKEVALKDTSNNKIEIITYNKVNYLPIQPIAKALGWTMTYDAKTKAVTLKGTTAQAATTVASSTTTTTIGTPPTGGTPPSTGGTSPSTGGTSPATGEMPTGTPPTGEPPTGGTSPSTGTPPTGTPPTGTPPTNNGATDTKTTAVTTAANSTTTAATNAKITKTKATTLKISAIYGQKYTVNSKTITLANTSTVTLAGFVCNGVVYLPVKAVEQVFSFKSSVDTKNSVIMLTGGASLKGAATTPTTQSSVTGTAVYKVSSSVETLTDKTYVATKANQSAVIVSKGGSATLSNVTVTKSGDSTAVETSNFTGLNAGVLIENGGQLSINDGVITTDAEGSNAVVSTGEGSKVTIDGITINTSKDSARGLHATYNGTIIASDVNIHTKGAHSGAITTDRGEGTVTVNGGTVVTSGEGSPGIYSTGNITVSNLTSTSSGSEAAVIEGKNSITLTDSILSGAKKWGVMIYQSFSGDAGTGTGTFTMTGGSLTAATGPLFYSTNTNGVIHLTGVKLSQTSDIFIQADGNNQWGTKGSNGSNLVVTADSQTVEGSIVADAISTVKMTLKNASTLTGAINGDNTAKVMALSLDASSIWNVTGDSYLTTIVNEDIDLSNIIDNGHNVYYDSSQSANSWLEGKTITLAGGGILMPVSAK